MATRERRADRGRQRGLRMQAELGRALRLARRAAGLTQSSVARLVGTSQNTVSRIERGYGPAEIVLVAMIASVVGLELAASLYPGGAPVRDVAQVKLMDRLRRLLPAGFVWRTEVPIPIPGDQRNIDAMISSPRLSVGFELESRLMDGQRTVRRTILKQRDAGLPCMVLVFADTAANREAVAAASATLTPDFPLSSRELLAALRDRRAPAANGILFA